MLTLRQYADRERRSYATENGISLKEMREMQPDNWYQSEHVKYVEGLADAEVFSAHSLNAYYRDYGGNALRILMKFYPRCVPIYYVHPDCRPSP